MSFNLRLKSGIESVREQIHRCSNSDHVQQVAFSTYHDALTQVCFSCRKIRTNAHELSDPDEE